MIQKDIGFVLHRWNFRETSLIANIYSLNFGKITGILKGFYSLKKEFSSPLTIGSLNEFIFYPRKSAIWLISFTDLISNYSFLANDITKSKIAMLFIELINRVMHPWDSNSAIFYLLRDSLEWLEKKYDKKIIYAFLIKFLTFSGFKPQLDRCIICEAHLTEKIFFSISKGGLVCKNCGIVKDNCQEISRETFLALLYIQNNDFDLIFRLNLSINTIREIHYILKQFLLYHLEFNFDLDYID